jgi:ABC-type multidrug transport system fused ATPase/permease subunit
LMEDGFKRFLNARWSLFSQINQGRILNTFQNEIVKVGDAMTGLATQFALVFQLVIALSLPILLTPLMVIVSLGALFILTVPFFLLQPINNRLGHLNTTTASKAMEILNETFQCVKLILGYGRQKVSVSRYLNAYDEHVKITLKSQLLSTGVSTIHYTIGVIAALTGMVVALEFGGLLSDIAISLWSLQRAVPLLNQMLVNKVNLDNFSGSYEQLQILYKEAEKHEEVYGNLPFNTLTEGIGLEKINFQYPDRNLLFNELNLFIPKGKMIALVGESGSGKSTIVDLILGLQIPDSGKLLIDRIPFEQLNKNSYRDKIGYVPQDPVLFHATIRENLLWSYENATDLELWKACEISNAKEFISLLPLGLDTIVGDRGVRLSGGQRQRIALARALIRKPELLILDEATSALDTESEKLIQQSIEKIRNTTTILVIAHRLSTIVKSDKIYVLNGGKIIEEGSFIELSSNEKSSFYRMAQAQS